MNKTYDEIISVVRGDINNLESYITGDNFFAEAVLKSLILAPAKRIRSVLAFLFLRAFGLEISEKQLNLQCAVELAHTASLIHDDIIDKSEKRRGTYTLNSIYGDKYAVLAGDFTLTVAFNKIISLNNNSITEDFLKVFSEMVKGEISQLISKGKIPVLDEYMQKTRQKTAGLFAVSLKSAAILAGKTELAAGWHDFGYNFGTAFQIKNDLKDLTRDINDGVYTAPVIFSQNPECITEQALLKTKNLINHNLTALEAYLENLPENRFSQALKELLELYKEC